MFSESWRLSAISPFDWPFERNMDIYPGTETYVLKNINTKFKTGKKQAFVGANGAGKTHIYKVVVQTV